MPGAVLGFIPGRQRIVRNDKTIESEHKRELLTL